jgi:hypothetical protein
MTADGMIADGMTTILTGGDMVFQPRKIERSRLWQIDDKLPIPAAVKKIWGARVTRVFSRQGHCAVDPAALATYPEAEISIAHISDLLHVSLDVMICAARKGVGQ